jgi:predicted P-loop ATPase
LAIRDDWFVDDVPIGADSKKKTEQTAGKLIAENSELSGLKRAEIEIVKSDKSRTTDRSRKAYGHFAEDVPRQHIEFASTNDRRYFKDPTGNRRFIPLKVGEVDLGRGEVLPEPGMEHLTRFELDHERLTERLLDLWGEAAYREARGESIQLPRELWQDAQAEQHARLERDPWIDEIEAVLGEVEGGRVLVADVRRIVSKNPERWSDSYDQKLGRAMKTLGWERRRLRAGGKGNRPYFYTKGEPPYNEVTLNFDPYDRARASSKKPKKSASDANLKLAHPAEATASGTRASGSAQMGQEARDVDPEPEY